MFERLYHIAFDFHDASSLESKKEFPPPKKKQKYKSHMCLTFEGATASFESTSSSMCLWGTVDGPKRKVVAARRLRRHLAEGQREGWWVVGGGWWVVGGGWWVVGGGGWGVGGVW